MKKLPLLMFYLSLLSSFPIVVEAGSNQIKSNIETETMNFSAEVSHGFVNGSYGVDLWYVWLNTSGTHLLFLAMYSTVYPSPINYFIGQHYFTANDIEVFIGNRFLGFEIYEDLDDNSLLDANYSNGFDKTSDEARYFFHLNASKTVDLIPPSKNAVENITHYYWGIHHKQAQGIIIKIGNQSGAYVGDPETGEWLPSFFKGLNSATLSSLSFSFDYWVENNVAYLKTGLETGSFSELTEPQFTEETITLTFNNNSLSALYSTSVLSPKSYNVSVESSEQPNQEYTGMVTSRIDISQEEAFRLVIGDSYTLDEESTSYSTMAKIYSIDSLPGDVIHHAKHFTQDTEDIFKQYFQKMSPSFTGNASLSIKQSSLIYRICYPIWGNRTLSYDPLYIAYIGQPHFLSLEKIGVPLPQTLLIATLILGIAVFVVAVHRHIKIRGYKGALLK